MKKTVIGFIFVLLLIVAGVVYYFSQQTVKPQVSISPTPQSTGTKEGAPLATNEASTKETAGKIIDIRVEAKEFSFKPGDLTLKAGQKYRLTLKNTGKMSHDWVLEGTTIKTERVSGGKETTVEFSLDAPGQYTFYCSVFGHRSAGMEGKLTVE